MNQHDDDRAEAAIAESGGEAEPVGLPPEVVAGLSDTSDSEPQDRRELSILLDSVDQPGMPAEPPRPVALWVRLGIVVALVGLAAGLFYYGVQIRKEQWVRTHKIRFINDVTNGFGWGKIANRVGLFHVYDLYAAGLIHGPNELDYTPLRLAIVNFWARLAEKRFPGVNHWNNDYELTRPMLRINTAAEVLSAILVFLLIRLWVIRMDDANRHPLSPARPFRGVIQGMLGAAFLWFNPAVIWDSHAFPQWDVWNMPFYLAAVLLASTQWWFAAGCCVVVGAFLKGQILLVAPIFILWPLMQLRYEAALRFVCGLAFGAALLALPWMHPPMPGRVWYVMALVGVAMTIPLTLRSRWDYRILLACGVFALALAWPWRSEASFTTRLWPVWMVGVLWLSYFLPRRYLPPVYAMAVAGIIFMLMPLYGASSTWFSQGFEFGTKKLMWMATNDTYSIPWLMVTYFRWSHSPQQASGVTLLGWAPSVRDLMMAIYAVCLILCAAGAAIHDRRKDTRFLVAMVAPWLCWFVLLTQLNNRYLIWASGLSGLLVGVGLGMTLLGVIVSIIGWAGIAQIMCWSGGDPKLANWVNPVTPHLTWVLILAAAVYLYVAVAPRARRRWPPAVRQSAAAPVA